MTPSADFASAAAARFVSGLTLESIPAPVLEKARNCILYGFGIGLLCLDEATAQVAERAVIDLGGEAPRRGGTALISGRRMPVPAAVFANAVLLHSRCQEDTSGTAHLGVVTLSVALALVEAGLAEASDFLPGIVAGYEVAGTLEAAFGRDSMAAGLRASALYGTIAAAATAARMLRLPVEQIDAALANAAGFTGGTLQSIPEGSDEWRYQVGAAARSGLLATSLARHGSISARQSIEGGQGFVHAFARRELKPGELAFGQRWRLPDVTFKPYPVCAHNQTVGLIGAQIHDRVGPHDIDSIELRINPYVVPGMLTRGPFSRVAETLMSSYFCCASASLYGSVTMAQLGNFADPAVAELMPRIRIELDANVPFPSTLAKVQTRDGASVELAERRAFSDFSLGRAEVLAQLRRLAAEECVAAGSIDLLDNFAHGPVSAGPNAVVDAYEQARSGLRRAA